LETLSELHYRSFILNPFLNYKSHFVFLNSQNVKSYDFSVAFGFLMYLGQNDINLAPSKPEQSMRRFGYTLDDWKKIGSEYEQWSGLKRK